MLLCFSGRSRVLIEGLSTPWQDSTFYYENIEGGHGGAADNKQRVSRLHNVILEGDMDPVLDLAGQNGFNTTIYLDHGGWLVELHVVKQSDALEAFMQVVQYAFLWKTLTNGKLAKRIGSNGEG